MPSDRSHRRPRGVALACALTLAAAPPAVAALPDKGAKLVVHDHRTAGDNWHLELTVARSSRTMVSQLVLYAQRCGATVLDSGVPIGADGTIAATRTFTVRGGKLGTWRLDARFTNPRHLRGTFQVTTPGCDGGVRAFAAHTGGHGHAGAHRHGHLGGTRPGQLAAPARARPERLREARRLWRATLRSARTRFPTYRAAGALRFTPLAGKRWTRPLVFHLRRASYTRDARVLDAARPESLVYWWPRHGRPVLVAFMYRAPMGPAPGFAAPLLGWHTHGGKQPSQMTHVWLTRSLRTALANCLPVAALQAAIPAFRWDSPGQAFSAESTPCPRRTATAARSRTVRVGDNWFARASGVPTVTVGRGDTVTWRFVGREPHNVNAARGPARFTSPTRKDGVYRRRMTRRGTYRIVCDIHGAGDQRMTLRVR